MILSQMNRLSRFPLYLLPLLVWAPLSAQGIIPFSEIKTGMKGIGKTVFSGTRIDDFEVEVIGTLEKIGPKRNLILVRLSGGPLANTGVLSGMSGSPIFFGDRLAGAVAYTWGFAREPVAGVTPIQEMLQVEDKESVAGAVPGRRTMAPSEGPPLALLKDPERLPAHFSSYFSRLPLATEGSTALTPIATPLVFSGVPERSMQRLAPDLARAGLVPTLGGASARTTASSVSEAK